MAKTYDALVSTGTTIGFGTSSLTFEWIDVPPNTATRESVDITHQGSTDWFQYAPVGLADLGTFNCTVHYDADDDLAAIFGGTGAMATASETITITWPLAAGQSTAATLAFTGYIEGFEGAGSFRDKLIANLTIRADGQSFVETASSA